MSTSGRPAGERQTVAAGGARWSTQPPPGVRPSGEQSWQIEVWAPGAHAVELCVQGGPALPLAPVPAHDGVGGYHAGTLEGWAAGTGYRFCLDGGPPLADPASRWQPQGVHGPSALWDPGAFAWDDAGFCAPPLEESVFYELHVGTLTPAGTLEGAEAVLDQLVDLGVTTVELMPLAQFPGARNWGYDGAFPYAVHNTYGGPSALQHLVAACHRRGLAVALDVVYNHLGPEGCVLPRFGPYTTERYATPWGPAINMEGWGSDEVRRYFVANALWWFDAFHLDVLRLDAVHGIVDPTARPFLLELAEATAALAQTTGRRLLLVAESADNDPRLLRSAQAGGMGLDGVWNDDFHHALITVVTGEKRGYYRDYGSMDQLVRSLEEGFVFQGQFNQARGRRHGAPLAGIAPSRLVVFAQNHDQVGNRPRGDRLASLAPGPALRAVATLTLLSPATPLVFMGEEYGEVVPFPYFVDHGDPRLVAAVCAGRAAEMGDLWGSEPLDPADPATFVRAQLDPARRDQQDPQGLLALYRSLLDLRRSHPALAPGGVCRASAQGPVVSLHRQGPNGRAPKTAGSPGTARGPETARGPRTPRPPELLVAVNLSARPASFVLPEDPEGSEDPQGASGGWQARRDERDGRPARADHRAPGLSQSAPLLFGPWGLVVLEREPAGD